MKKIEAIIRKTKFDEVKEALFAADINWFSYTEVRAIGQAREDRIYRGVMYSTDIMVTKPPMKSGPPVAPVIQVVSLSVHPNRKLTATHIPRPSTRCQRAFVRSPMTPLISLETP